MTTHNIVWVVGGKLRVLALVGAVAAAAGCNGGSGETTLLDPSPLRPPAVHSVTGTVYAAMEEGALPVEGAHVAIANESAGYEATTDADGRYGFALPAGRWMVVVEKEGFAAASAELDLTDSTNLDFLLEPDAQ